MFRFSFRPLPLLRQGVLRFAFIPAQLFPRGPLTNELEARAQISRWRERSGRQDVPERSGPEGWNGVLAA